ncbi:major capsid family protein [Bosea sp. ASV33]|uniref:major capsid family protein n=1 Tax=Bosea sp. ASV33 TaxID=2795106 RepID=UPI0018EA90E8|nr:major capsid family protein [Bosea sp. ASV33]
MNFQEAAAAWKAHVPMHEQKGVYLSGVTSYIPDGVKADISLAMDAVQPALATDPNSAIPAFLTTMVDPQVFHILFSPNKGAQIFGENRKGGWLDETAMFPVVEHTGEVSSYGDYAENGRAGANTNWPQRQAYLFQTVKEYGDREIERAGLARIGWVAEIDTAAATILDKFMNLTYHFGVAGLQNYGLLNDPNLSASLTPATKAAGGVKWINNGAIVATANEIYADVQAIYLQLVTQTAGLIQQDTPMVLAMSPSSEVALTATNSFGISVYDLLKKNFPNLRVESDVLYGSQSAANPQGNAAGNLVQLIAESVDGQDTGYCSFNEKMRTHPIVRQLSSFRQKVTAGSWGAIIRMPAAIASMVGV